MKIINEFARKALCIAFLTLSLTGFGQKEKFLLNECYNFHHTSYNAFWESKYMFDLLMAEGYVLKGGADLWDEPAFNEISSFQLTSSSKAPLEIWKVYYNGIEKANTALAYISDVSGNEQYRAEAKFIRAYCYFNLVRLFGGVPIITEDCSASLTNISRASASNVYAQIEKDLTEAIPNLPQKSALSGTEKYRATKGAAHAVFAEACLYQQKWSDAATHLAYIINSGQYALLAKYSDLWLMSKEHNQESIYEYEYYSDKAYDWNTANWVDPESNMLIQYSGPRPENITLKDTNYNYGWGFFQVTQNLVDLFNAQGDTVRRNATILFLDSIGTKNYSGGYEYTGYKSKKYITRKANTAGPVQELNYGQNIVEIRYADVLLMYAEALARQGDAINATMYVNLVRARAGLPDLSPGLTTADLLEAIFTERTLEFALEGKHFLDIVRWNKGSSLLGSQGYKSYNNLWPIPDEVMGEYPSVMQNPGYNSGAAFPLSITPRKNDYAPKATFPWVKVAAPKIVLSTMKQYKYNYCMDDSVMQSQASYSYDTLNRMTSYTESYKNLLDIYKEVYTYDSLNRLTSLTRMQSNMVDWDTIQLNYFSYPDEKTIIDSLGYYTNGAPYKFIVNRYGWNPEEKYYQARYGYWSKSGPNVFIEDSYTVSETKTYLTYDSNNQISEEVTKHYDKNAALWRDSLWTETVFNNGVMTKRENYKISTDTTLLSKTIYDYDTNNKLTAETNYVSSDTTPANGVKYYNGNSTYQLVKTPLQYLSLLDTLHHNRERKYFIMNTISNHKTQFVSYQLPNQKGNSVIDTTNHTIEVTMPEGSSVASLVASFVLSDGASSKIGAVAQISGTTSNDFTSTVTYTITAEDGTTTQDWTVTVTIATGTSSVKEAGITVYNNPSTGLFRVQLDAQKQVKFSVYNVEGAVVLEKVVNATGEQIVPIDLTNKPKGIYLLKISNKGKTDQIKLVLQ
jgi:SusD family.